MSPKEESDEQNIRLLNYSIYFISFNVYRDIKLATMCSKVICPTCHKVTYAGCGQHIDGVVAGLKPEQICPSVRTGGRDCKGHVAK